MNRVLIFSEQAEFSDALASELRRRLDCDITTSGSTGLFSAEIVIPPHLIIIDAHPPSLQLDDSLALLFERIPDANVIMLSRGSRPSECARFIAIGVLEVLCRPEGLAQIREAANKIARTIRLNEDSSMVHQNLLTLMRGHGIVARSRAMREIVASLPRLANSDATVLIDGETGTGKELIARAIHYLGPRTGGPFVTVDCGAIPESLMENELFGHARGAYTGASGGCGGLLLEANGGTIFLDEVEALPLNVQTRFLRVLQEHEYRPLGQSEYHRVNARAIASTNTDLAHAVRRQAFREDLYHRLSVIRVFIPPLRDRTPDVPALVHHFVECHASGDRPLPRVPEAQMAQWLHCPWPGNVRELENRVREWLLNMNAGPDADSSVAHSHVAAYQMTLSSVREEALEISETSYFREILASTSGNISRAAKLAGVDRKTLALLLKKRGIDPVRFRGR